MNKTTFPQNSFKKLLEIGLLEDLGSTGDITSLACLSPSKQSLAQIIAKQDGLICGLPVIESVLQEMEIEYRVKLYVKEGDFVHLNQTIASIESSTHNLLVCERTILNFMQNLSGISTATYRIIQALQNSSIKVLDTRKILSGYRKLHKYAVLVGGGCNHRSGLYDQILIKENHLSALDNDINLAIQKSLDYVQGKLKIEVEVQNQSQLENISNKNIDQIMLDNMNVKQMQTAIHWIRKNLPRTKIEASGNLSLKSIPKINHLDLDFISIGSITHSTTAFDLSMIINK